MLETRSVRARLALLACTLATGACAATPAATTAVHPAFAPDAVRSIAVLPFFEWQLSLRDTRAMAKRTMAALDRTSPALTVITPDESSAFLVSEGLTYAWATYLSDERAEAPLDRTVIMRMADALGADLLAHIRFIEALQHDGSAALGPAFSRVVVELRLFDGDTGEVQWRSASGVEEVRNDARRAPALDGIASEALAPILESLPAIGVR